MVGAYDGDVVVAVDVVAAVSLPMTTMTMTAPCSFWVVVVVLVLYYYLVLSYYYLMTYVPYSASASAALSMRVIHIV